MFSPRAGAVSMPSFAELIGGQRRRRGLEPTSPEPEYEEEEVSSRQQYDKHPLNAVPTPLALLNAGGAEEKKEAEDLPIDPLAECRLGSIEKFILQWDISHFGMALGFSAFTVLWNRLSDRFEGLRFLYYLWHVTWYASVMIAVLCAFLYCIRGVIFFPSCVSDFRNGRLVNFFFAPVIVAASLTVSVPPTLDSDAGQITMFWILLVAQGAGALFLYGDWLFGGEYSVKEIHPLFFMATIGWFLVAGVGGPARQDQAAQFSFAVGSLFWLIIFVTTFQHLTHVFREKLESPQPTMFLFIAPPAAAALAWIAIERPENIMREAQDESATNFRPFFFLYITMFVYMLVLRLFPLFWTHPFGVVWWAYIFPLSTAAGAFVWYSDAVNTTFFLVVALVTTAIAAFAWVVVLALTLWGFSTGQLPNNHKALVTYCEVLRSKRAAAEDLV